MMTAPRRLLGAHLVKLGRAADLQHFTFALPPDYEATIALHVSCPWRIVGAKGILVGSRDYWRPATADMSNEQFDQDTVGTRLNDVGNASVRQLLGNGAIEVVAAEADPLGGLIIKLSKALTIEAFPDASTASHDEVEFWRLVESGAPHVVISSDGLDYVA